MLTKISLAISLFGMLLLSSVLFLQPMIVSAQGTTAQTDQRILDNLGSAATKPFNATSGESRRTPGEIVGNIIKVVLGFTGTVAFIIFLYGGFMWLTARGNEDQVSKAKKYLTNGIIGTVIVILAYSVTFYITDVLFKATQG